jgi:hypothetical protein
MRHEQLRLAMKKPRFGTISGRGAWATTYVVVVSIFMLVFAALIPLAIACKSLFYETNPRVRALALGNVFLAGWLAAWATLCVEFRPTPWLSDEVNYAILDFYAGLSAFGPAFLALV